MAEEEREQGGGRSTEGGPAEGGQRPPHPKNVDDLMLQTLPWRGRKAGESLRTMLAGSIQVRLRDAPQGAFLVQWNGPELQVTKGAPATGFECEIESTSDQLMRVAAGHLNPQIGMLAGKIRVTGKNTSPAIYLFNLLAPQERG